MERWEGLCTDIDQRSDAIVAAVQPRKAELVAECRTLSDAKEPLVEQRDATRFARKHASRLSLVRNAIERGTAGPSCAIYAREQLLSDLQHMQAQLRVRQPMESAMLTFVDTQPMLLQDTAASGGVTGGAIGTRRRSLSGTDDQRHD